MATNTNEVDMPRAMKTISPFSLSYSQNCTSKCCESRLRGRFRRTMDSIGRTAEANEGVGVDDGVDDGMGRTKGLGRAGRWVEWGG